MKRSSADDNARESVKMMSPQFAIGLDATAVTGIPAGLSMSIPHSYVNRSLVDPVEFCEEPDHGCMNAPMNGQSDVPERHNLCSLQAGTAKWTSACHENVKRKCKSRRGLIGLQNLGNTCFMNSALQCLLHCRELVDFFALSTPSRWDVYRTNSLGKSCQIADAFRQLVAQVWSDDRAGSASVTPHYFKNVIAQIAPQFEGYLQHDSHELLSFVLDGLHEDLNRVATKPYIDISSVLDSEKITDCILMGEEYWKIHKMRNDSCIVDLFQGQLRNQLICPKCLHSSITFDPFMSLSLPIPRLRRMKKIPCVFLDPSEPIKFVEIDSSGCFYIGDIKRALNIELRKSTSRQSTEEACPPSVFWIASKQVDNQLDAILSDYATVRNPFDISSLIFYQADPDLLDRYIWVSFERRYADLGVFECGTPSSHVALTFPRLMPLNERSVIPSNEAIRQFFSLEDVSFTVEASSGVEDPAELNAPRHQFCYNVLRVIISNEIGDLEGTSSFIRRCISGEHFMNSEQDAVVNEQSLSLDHCVSFFMEEEQLSKDNEWFCPKCKDFSPAFKKMDLWKLPQKFLILHLKRFKDGSGYMKNTDLVNFPLKQLILPASGPLSEESVVWDLVAVSNHMGSLSGGHYTAFANLSGDDAVGIESSSWWEFNDSTVVPINETDVVSSAAYLLFYRKRD